MSELESGRRFEGAGKYAHQLFRHLQEMARKEPEGDLDSWVSQFDNRLDRKDKSRLEQIVKETRVALLDGGALAFLPEWLEWHDETMRSRITTAEKAIEEGGEESKAQYQKEIDKCTKILIANQIIHQKLRKKWLSEIEI